MTGKTAKDLLTPPQALKRYRRHAPEPLLTHVREFNKMGINDRIELLFFMMLHSNQQLADVSESVGEPAPDLQNQPEEIDN